MPIYCIEVILSSIELPKNIHVHLNMQKEIRYYFGPWTVDCDHVYLVRKQLKFASVKMINPLLVVMHLASPFTDNQSIENILKKLFKLNLT